MGVVARSLRWIRPVGIATVLAMAPVVARPAAAITAGDWPQYAGGSRHRSSNPAETAIGASTVAKLTIAARTVAFNPPWRRTPVVADGAIYAVGRTGASMLLWAFDAFTAKKRWSLAVGRDDASTPAVIGDSVIVQSDTGMRAVDPTGHQRWVRTDLAGHEDFAGQFAAVTTDSLVLARTPGALTAIDPTTGVTRWQRPTDPSASSYSVPSASATTAFLQDGKTLRALDLTTGAQRWVAEFPTDGIFGSVGPIAVDNATLVVAIYDDSFSSHSTRLAGVDARTGKIRYRTDKLTSDGWTGLALSSGIAYLGSFGVDAIDARTGAVRWSVDYGNDEVNFVTVANGLVFAPAHVDAPNDGIGIEAAATGARVAALTAPQLSAMSGAVVSHGELIVAAKSGLTIWR